MTKRITVTFTDRQVAHIAAAAIYRNIPQAEVIRRCVNRAYLTEKNKKWWQFWK